MQISISTCVIYDRPLNEFLPHLLDAGFTELELGKRSRQQSGGPEALERAGFTVHAVHARVGPDGLYAASAADRRAALEPVFADIDDSARFGPRRYVFHWVYREPGLPRLEHWRESVGHIIDHCERHGIVLCMETVSHKPQRTYVESERIVDFMRSFDSPWARMCLDTNHTNVKESLPHVIEACGDLLETIHVSDNHGVVEEHLPPGDGVIDFDAVVRALQATGYLGPYNLEVVARNVEPGPLLARLYRDAHDLLSRHGAHTPEA